MSDFETVIGLEVHVELSTATKAFCGCPTKFGSAPNTQVCPVCLGHPGVLPVLNRTALDYSIKLGLALGCQIARRFKFDRKHYYYPDLPKNYQISQYDMPFATGGLLTLPNGKTIRVHRAHLEEDAGKLIHEGADEKIGAGTAALVDYNRAGIPLLEIVSEPDLRDPADAVLYIRSIQSIVRYLGISDANMDEGRLRCDANISVRGKGEEKLGAKVEIKNMNSFRSIEKALEFESRRQRESLARGDKPVQETRLFDEETGETRPMRGKEEAHDYRYFPEPDLLPFTVSDEMLSRLRREIPELPAARLARYISGHGLSPYDAQVLTGGKEIADFFEAAIGAGAPAKLSANWITTELLGALNAAGKELRDSAVTPAALAELIGLIENGTISGKIAKTVFTEMFETGRNAAGIVKEKGLVQISDTESIRKTVEQVVAQNPASVADFKSGKKQAIGHLVGGVMKATGGKANPGIVNRLLKEILEKQ